MASRKPKTGLEGVAKMMAGAEVVPISKNAAGAGDPVPGDRGQDGGRGARRRGSEEPELPMLPADCPIVCLGKRKQKYYFLDELGELIELAADKVAQKGIISLFGRRADKLREYWPRFRQQPDEFGQPVVNGWKVDVASELLMAACATEGVFDPIAKVRGRGAHLGEDGSLILHCGDMVLVGEAPERDDPDRPGERLEARPRRWHHPGLIDDFVYPTGPSGQRPANEPVSTEWAEKLLALVGCWRWKRPIDAVLVVGFIMAAMAGGALRWRPHVWITGDSATGKSTLQELLERMFDGSLLQSADATEAGIRQILNQDTLPVALDEAEAEDGSTGRMNALVKLARIASSGGQGVRGGADHQGHTFSIKSSFLFSSVLMPPMLPQDRNRLAILELMPLDRTAKPPVLDPSWLRACGRAFRRRLVDHWPRFAATLIDYRAMLAEVGHGGRSADQFGALLACADLALYDFGGSEDDDDARRAWTQALAADLLIERADEMSNADRCVNWIASSSLPSMGGEAPADVGIWIMKALDSDTHAKARDRLGAAGMRVVQRVVKDDKTTTGDPAVFIKLPIKDAQVIGELFLAVASAHRGLDPLFKDTPWQGRAGATGGWGQALRRVPGAIAGEKVRIGGKAQNATLVPLELFSQLDEGLTTW